MSEEQLDRQLTDIFFVESGEMLSEASLALLRAEEAGNPQEIIHQVLRAIHSIKGGAQSLGFEHLSEMAHCIEDFLVSLRQGNGTVDEQTVSLILQGMDVIEMQLRADRSGEASIACDALLTMLAEATLATDGSGTLAEAKTISSQEATVIGNRSRLLYVSFTVDPSAAMPGITAFIFLEQLRKSGRVLYSQPDIDNPGMAVSGELSPRTAIIETGMSNADVEQEAHSVGDIGELKVAELRNGMLSNAAMPAKEELSYFNSLTGEIRKMLSRDNREQVRLHKMVRQFADWGADSRGAADWFPGGFPAWQKMTSLLSDMICLIDQSKSACEAKSVAVRLLEIVWGLVYNALCNHTYFYSVPVREIIAGNGLQVIKGLETGGVDVQVVTIDLSEWMILEGEHLKALADFRDELAKNGWLLWLISEGKYTRRHLNILEVAEEFVGALELYPSIYDAVLVLEKFKMLGANRHVSEFQDITC